MQTFQSYLEMKKYESLIDEMSRSIIENDIDVEDVINELFGFGKRDRYNDPRQKYLNRSPETTSQGYRNTRAMGGAAPPDSSSVYPTRGPQAAIHNSLQDLANSPQGDAAAQYRPENPSASDIGSAMASGHQAPKAMHGALLNGVKSALTAAVQKLHQLGNPNDRVMQNLMKIHNWLPKAQSALGMHGDVMANMAQQAQQNAGPTTTAMPTTTPTSQSPARNNPVGV